MNQTVNLLGHPVHQMLVVFPAGLLLSSALVDLAVVAGAGSRALELAYGLLGLGLLGGMAVAPFGWLDWRRIPHGTRARAVGALHGAGNAVALVLFAVSWFMREPDQSPPAIALGLSLVAGACMLGTAWLGGELVTRLGVGVHVGANLDAPSSLASPTTLRPQPHDHGAADLLTSVAGEEDPGAAVDPPSSSPATRP